MTALLIVLAVLFCIAWLPIGCSARYDGVPLVRIQVGPVHFTVVPGKEKPKKEKKTKKPKEKAPKETKPAGEKNKISLQTVQQFLPMVQTALQTVGKFLRATAVHLQVHVTYGAQDPADRALRYGQAWALISVVTPLIENTFRVKKRDIQAVFDPDETSVSILAVIKARLFLWQILAIFGAAGVKILIHFMKLKKGGANK